MKLPCFYEHECSYSHIRKSENPKLILPDFASAPAHPHPTSSQLILAFPKALSTFISPKTLVSTFIWIFCIWSGFRVSLGIDSICITIFGLLVLKKGPYEWLVITKAIG